MIYRRVCQVCLESLRQVLDFERTMTPPRRDLDPLRGVSLKNVRLKIVELESDEDHTPSLILAMPGC